MKEPLSTSKLIRDLGGRPPEAFFGAAWDERNKIDIARARELHRDAVNKANAPKLLLELVQEEPDSAMEGHSCTSDCRRIGCEDVEAQQRRAETLADSDFVNYDVELMREAEERGDDDVEAREEIGE
jgi:hypothetical protein